MASIAAQTIIDEAAALLHAINPGETLTTSETSYALKALNELTDSLSIESANVPYKNFTDFPMTTGVQSYTMGPSGAFNINPRPTRLDNSAVVRSSLVHDVKVVSEEEWKQIDDLSTSGLPKICYPDMSGALITLYFWPKPSANDTFRAWLWMPLPTFADLSTTYYLNPGLQRLLTYNLVKSIAASFQLPVPASVAEIADTTLAAWRKFNATPDGQMPPGGQINAVMNENAGAQ